MASLLPCFILIVSRLRSSSCFILLLSCFVFFQSKSQELPENYSTTVLQVVSEMTHEPVAFTTVSVSQYDRTLLYSNTDEHGCLELSDLMIATYQFQLIHEGFVITDTTVVWDKSTDTCKLFLSDRVDVNSDQTIFYAVPLLNLSSPAFPSHMALTSAPYYLSSAQMLYAQPVLSYVMPVTSAVGYYFDPYACMGKASHEWDFIESLHLEARVSGLETFSINDKMGLMDGEGHQILPPAYDRIAAIQNASVQRFVVQKGNYFGVINGQGEWIIPCEYDRIYISQGREQCIHERNLIVVEKNGLFGTFTINGDQLIGVNYQEIGLANTKHDCPAQQSKIQVTKDGKKGLVDQSGNVLLSMEYDSIESSNYHACSVLYKDGKQALLLKNGTIWRDTFFDEVELIIASPYVRIYENGRCGMVGFDGDVYVPSEYDYVTQDYATGRYFFVEENNKWGVVDRWGRKIVEPAYDEIQVAQPDGIYLAYRVGNKWGLMNLDGTVLHKPSFDKVRGHDTYWHLYRVGNYWGFVGKDPTQLTPPRYDFIFIYGRNYVGVRRGGKYGVCDRYGRVIVDLIADQEIETWKLEEDGCVTFKQNGLYGLVDSTGKILIKPLYAEPLHLSHYKPGTLQTLVGIRNGKKILLRTDGVELIGTDYDNFFAIPDGSSFYITEKNSLYGIVDGEGSKILEPVYAQIYSSFSWRSAGEPVTCFKARTKEGRGVVSVTGEIVFPFVYKEVKLLNDSLIEVTLNDSFAQFTFDQKQVTPYASHRVTSISGATSIIQGLQGTYGLADLNGNIICPPRYAYIETLKTGELFKVYSNSYEGVMDVSGNLLVEPIYQNVKYYAPGFLALKKGGLYAFADSTGRLTCEHQFEKVKEVNGNWVVVRLNNKWGVVNRYGQIVLPIIFDQEIPISYTWTSPKILTSDSHYGLVGVNLELLLEPVYANMVLFQTSSSDGFISMVLVKKDSLYALFDLSGNQITPYLYEKYSGLSYSYDTVYRDGKWYKLRAIGKEEEVSLDPVNR